MISTPPVAVRLPHYTETELAEITGGAGDPFGTNGLGLAWRPKDVHFGVRQGGRLVAHAGWAEVTMRVGDARLRLGGLGGVIVAPAFRGRGLARLVVAAAVEHTRDTGADFGLLFCLPERVPVYERLGWRLLDDEVRVEQPGGPVRMPIPAMWIPPRDTDAWPPGPARLLTLPV
ncbi:GNAT family N-acetyltransferase [Streptomyces sp. NPDC001889]